MMSGANDGEACQKRKDVTHLTLRGPQRGKSDLFSKYVSPYSTEGILSLVYSTYPAISTGVIREFPSLYSYRVPFAERSYQNFSPPLMLYSLTQRWHPYPI